MAQTSTAALDALIKRYEDRLAEARRVRDTLVKNPEIREALLVSAHEDVSITTAATAAVNGHTKSTSDTDENHTHPISHFDKIRHAFAARGNMWTGGPDIAREAGVPIAAIGAIFYKAHNDAFEWKPRPDRVGQKLWRLKKEYLPGPDWAGGAEGREA